jgi:hypothetical protein
MYQLLIPSQSLGPSLALSSIRMWRSWPGVVRDQIAQAQHPRLQVQDCWGIETVDRRFAFLQDEAKAVEEAEKDVM